MTREKFIEKAGKLLQEQSWHIPSQQYTEMVKSGLSGTVAVYDAKFRIFINSPEFQKLVNARLTQKKHKKLKAGSHVLVRNNFISKQKIKKVLNENKLEQELIEIKITDSAQVIVPFPSWLVSFSGQIVYSAEYKTKDEPATQNFSITEEDIVQVV